MAVTLCVGMHWLALCASHTHRRLATGFELLDAERPGLHSHAERGNDQNQTTRQMLANHGCCSQGRPDGR